MVSRSSDDFLLMWRGRITPKAFWHLFKGPVLDIGCGKGTFVNDLTRHGFDTYGVDIGFFKSWRKKAALKMSPDIPQDRLVAGIGEDLPFDDETFNTVFDSDGPITYCNNPGQFDRTLSEYLRVLRSGGRIIITSAEIVNGGRSFIVANNWQIIVPDDAETSQVLEHHSLAAVISKSMETQEISVRTILTNIEYDSVTTLHNDFGLGIITKLKRTSAA
ncbi:MAG: SAM-dependent methyltransferase [Candidatus Berkelbacteria bacterium]|nr:SAM-dependent methyltransferase [Candidatus Berkelbacteria bacterium]